MKKLLFVAAIALISFASCKKDHTCTCTIGGNTSVSQMPDTKKKDAQDACDALQTTAKMVDAAAACTLD